MFDARGDPYSGYLSPEDFQATLQGIWGHFEGIGAEIGTQNATGATTDCATLGPDCRLVVLSPLEGPPAKKAGLKPGALILTVDGTSLAGRTADGARNGSPGKKGTEADLPGRRKAETPR